jgi:hypothetical protein
MSWHIIGDERLRCPRQYQEHITRIGGRNRYGKPNFIIVWGQTHTQIIYGQMQGRGRGAHTILQFGGIPAWHVMEWKPPETFGTPFQWYSMTWDAEADLHALGEYPWHGLYIPCSFNLYVKRIHGGGLRYDNDGNVVELPTRLEIDAMPLNFYILDMLIPNVRKALEMTHTQKKLAIETQMERDKKARLQRGYDAYLNAQPAFGGVAGTYESNRDAWMRRIEEKQRGMKLTAEDVRRLLGSGHTQLSGKVRR